jgi:predicted amidophosphoribosyltransferase
VKGKSLLVVDDVITTGATVYAFAKTLRGAGAKAIYVVSVARG